MAEATEATDLEHQVAELQAECKENRREIGRLRTALDVISAAIDVARDST